MSHEPSEWKEEVVVNKRIGNLKEKVKLVEITQLTIKALMENAKPGGPSQPSFAETLSNLIASREQEYLAGLEECKNISQLIEARKTELKRTTQASTPQILPADFLLSEKNSEFINLHSDLIDLEYLLSQPNLNADLRDMIDLDRQLQGFQKQPHRSEEGVESSSVTSSALDIMKKRPRGFAANFAQKVLMALTTAPSPSVLEQKASRASASIVGPANFMSTHSNMPPIPLHRHLSLVSEKTVAQNNVTQSSTSQSSLSPRVDS